jgi:hypothetical protein
MNYKKISIYIMMTFILLAQALGIGIAPGSVDIDSLTSHTETFYIINNEGKDMSVVVYAQGDNAEYLTLSDSIINVKSNEQTKAFTVTVNAPNLNKPGKHEIQLIAMEMPKEGSTQNTVATRQAVLSKINLVVPYPGKFIEAELVTPDKNAEEFVFAVKVKNLGNEIINEAHARIEIYSPTNDLIASIQTDKKSIKSKEMREIVARYQNQLNVGKYYAKAIVSYDGEELILEKTFEIGDLMVEVDNIYVSSFKLGDIAKFDIIIESKWNELITDLFADIEIKDKYGKVQTKFKTREIDVKPHSKEFLDAYWDTKDVTIGRYQAKISLHFLGNNIDKTISLDVKEDSIDIDLMPTANVIEGGSTAPGERDSMIIIIVIVSMVVNIGLFIIFARRKKQ